MIGLFNVIKSGRLEVEFNRSLKLELREIMSLFNPFVKKFSYQELAKMSPSGKIVGFNGAAFTSAKLNLKKKLFQFQENGNHHEWKVFQDIAFHTFTGETVYTFNCVTQDGGYSIDIGASRMVIENIDDKVRMIYGRSGSLKKEQEEAMRNLS